MRVISRNLEIRSAAALTTMPVISQASCGPCDENRLVTLALTQWALPATRNATGITRSACVVPSSRQADSHHPTHHALPQARSCSRPATGQQNLRCPQTHGRPSRGRAVLSPR